MDLDKLSVIIKTELDKSGIKADVGQIQKIINDNLGKIAPKLDKASLLNDIKSMSKDMANSINTSLGTNLKANDVFKLLKSSIDDATTSVKKLASESEKISAITRMQNYMTKNSAMTEKSKRSIQEWIGTIQSSDNLTKGSLGNINNQFKILDTHIRTTGKLGSSLGDGIKAQVSKFTQWIGISGAIMAVAQGVKGVISNVTQLDSSLLELEKVSDLSSNGLANVTNEAYKLGEAVGKTGTQVIDAVTEFKRAGYEMQDSMDMAKSALVLTNVAEGIKDTSESAGILISVLKGFNMTADQTMSIVDKINSTSNQSPIGFDNLAEGLQRTSGTLSQTGTSIEQTIGLLTAGFAQLRNIEKVSTGLITLSARIRGVDENGEVIDGLSATLQKDFGKIGVAIEDSSGNLRNLYDIMSDYSKALPNLTSKQKQYYGELAAGKRSVSVWNSVTQQFQDAQKATEQAIDSVGSPSVENQKYLDSISGKAKAFESAIQQVSSSLVDSDMIKFFIDLGTTGVKSIDGIVSGLTKISSLGGNISSTGGSLGMISGLIMSLTGHGKIKIVLRPSL